CLSSYVMLIHALLSSCLIFLFFNATLTTYLSTLSLHDALPIYLRVASIAVPHAVHVRPLDVHDLAHLSQACQHAGPRRVPVQSQIEEHTSELQSRENLVCRLLLEKKKKNKTKIALISTEST